MRERERLDEYDRSSDHGTARRARSDGGGATGSTRSRACCLKVERARRVAAGAERDRLREAYVALKIQVELARRRLVIAKAEHVVTAAKVLFAIAPASACLQAARHRHLPSSGAGARGDVARLIDERMLDDLIEDIDREPAPRRRRVH